MVISFFHKQSKHGKVPTFIWLFHNHATTAKGPECDEGTNSRLRDFAVVPLMPTRVLASRSKSVDTGKVHNRSQRRNPQLKWQGIVPGEESSGNVCEYPDSLELKTLLCTTDY